MLSEGARLSHRASVQYPVSLGQAPAVTSPVSCVATTHVDEPWRLHGASRGSPSTKAPTYKYSYHIYSLY